MTFFQQIDLGKFLNIGYIFETTPSPEGLYRYLAILFGLEIFTAIVIAIFNRRKSPMKKIKGNFFSLLLTTGIIGLNLIFSRFEEIPYLGSRLMLILLLLITVIWAVSIFWYWIVVLPKEIALKYEQERFQKYLPKTKKGYK